VALAMGAASGGAFGWKGLKGNRLEPGQSITILIRLAGTDFAQNRPQANSLVFLGMHRLWKKKTLDRHCEGPYPTASMSMAFADDMWAKVADPDLG
jgi:hypothetical protein